MELFKGLIFTDIKVNDSKDEIRFISNDVEILMYHQQDCCEGVYIDDISGDLQDLIGVPILVAEETTSSENPEGIVKDCQDSFTWTFYKFATINGYVDIRWYGESNGYYSESVNINLVKGTVVMTKDKDFTEFTKSLGIPNLIYNADQYVDLYGETTNITVLTDSFIPQRENNHRTKFIYYIKKNDTFQLAEYNFLYSSIYIYNKERTEGQRFSGKFNTIIGEDTFDFIKSKDLDYLLDKRFKIKSLEEVIEEQKDEINCIIVNTDRSINHDLLKKLKNIKKIMMLSSTSSYQVATTYTKTPLIDGRYYKV